MNILEEYNKEEENRERERERERLKMNLIKERLNYKLIIILERELSNL